jgi:hypothetical protein
MLARQMFYGCRGTIMANNSADIVKAEQKPAERQKQIGRNKGKKSHVKALTWGFFYDIPLDSLAI